MFFCIPLTHDRTVYGLPVVTLGIIGVCTAVWIGTEVMEQAVMPELSALEVEIADVVEKYPDARVPYHVEGLPRRSARRSSTLSSTRIRTASHDRATPSSTSSCTVSSQR